MDCWLDFLLLPSPPEPLAWIIALLYTAASIADWIDGYAARRVDQVTVLGQQLDIEFDGLGVAVVSLLAVRYGQLPIWFLSIGSCPLSVPFRYLVAHTA